MCVNTEMYILKCVIIIAHLRVINVHILISKAVITAVAAVSPSLSLPPSATSTAIVDYYSGKGGSQAEC